MFATSKFYIQEAVNPSNALLLGIFYACVRTDIRCLTPYMRCNDVYKSLGRTLTTGSGHRFFMPARQNLLNMQKSNETQATGLLEVFTFNQNSAPIRVQIINDEPWFVAKDVCEVLGITNSRDVVSRLDEDEKGVSVVPTPSGKQEMNLVNESGLYNLIFQSRKPEVKPFRKWVTSEVLPSIRKKGYYGIRREDNKYIDMRHVPYGNVDLFGMKVRCIQYENEPWYSLNDVHRALGASTSSAQSAKKLNASQVYAVKMWIFGNTHPCWFVNMPGVNLLVSNSRTMAAPEAMQLSFNF